MINIIIVFAPISLQVIAQMEILLTQHQTPVSVDPVPIHAVVVKFATRGPTHAVSFYTASNILDSTSQMYN